MKDHRPVDRRKFLAASVAAGAMVLPSRAVAAKSDVVRIAVIGCGARAQAHLHLLQQLAKLGTVKVVAVCDVWDGHEDEYEQTYNGQTVRRRYAQGLYPSAVKVGLNVGDRTAVTKDYRRVLDRTDVDAVLIATPDHHHADMVLSALQAGKDVLVEPPLALTAEEALAIADTVERTGKLVMLAEPSLTDTVVTEAATLVQAGRIGSLVQLRAEVFKADPRGYGRYYRTVPTMSEKTIDWAAFTGLKHQDVPFDPVTFSQWRCDARFGGGILTEFFTRPILRLLTATGLTMPRQVVASGGLYHERDGRSVPDVCTLIAEFDRTQLLLSGSTVHDAAPVESLRGRTGTLDLERGRIQITTRGKSETIAVTSPRNETEAMWQQFLDAVRTRQLPPHHLEVAVAAAVMTATPVY